MPDVDFLIIGAGACGLLTAVKLQQAGFPALVLERGKAPGGTWRDNVYPGLTCDVPSFVYEFSFARNDWKNVYATQPEILAYLQRIAKGVDIRYQTEVTEARWEGSRWRVGDLTARYLFLAAGAQGRPHIPTFAHDFPGDCFHSARWPVGYDFTGQRVGVVGTAASAVQLLPHVARQAREVVVFQRTPNWVLPKRDRPWHSWEKAIPRSWWRWRQDLSFHLFQNRWLRWIGERWALHLMRQKVPHLSDALTPRYPLGCKRILLANDFYETLALPHVKLQTTIALEGLDTLILATGFQVGDPPFPVHGEHGTLPKEAWLGVMAAGFPNLFMLLGPNSGLGHNSVWLMAEAQADFAIRALQAAAGRTIHLPQEAMQTFNDKLPERFRGLVWSAGCGSWYEDDEGRIFALYPGSVKSFRKELRDGFGALRFVPL